MNDCRYFEKLISDQLDNELENNQTLALNQHLNSCTNCQEFKTTIEKVRAKIKLFPTQEIKSVDNISTQSRIAINPFKKLWSLKITIPFPAAALLLLVLFSWSLTTFSIINQTENDQKQLIDKQENISIEYVQTERLKPVQAVSLPLNQLNK